MSLDENKAIARRFIEALNPQNLSALDDLVVTDYVDHTHQVQGLEVVKQLIE